MPDQLPNLDTLIIDSTDTMVIVADEEGRIIRYNDGGVRLLGYEKSEVLGRIVWELLPPPELRERARERFVRMIAGETLEMETVWLTRSGQRRRFSYVAKGVEGVGGGGKFMIGSAVDITARVEAENALRENEQRFRAVFHDSVIGVALVDAKGQYVQVNRAFCKLTGYTEDELRHVDLLALTHPEDRQRNSQLFHDLLVGKIPGYVFEKRYIRKNGDIIWVQVSASLASSGPGQPLTVIGLFQNTTDRRATAQALEGANRDLRTLTETLEQRVANRTKELESRTLELLRSKQEMAEQSQILTSVLQSMADAVYVVDETGTLILTNLAARRISGPIREGEDNVVGRANQPWFFNSDGTRCMPEDLPVMRSMRGEAIDDQEVLVHQPGRPPVWTSVKARPMRDEAGNLIGAVGVARDVTERKRHEAELELANERLRESEHHYRELAESNLQLAREVEHRVRNNLQGLLGLLDVMRDRATDVPSFADALQARLVAMAHVHELLARTQWTPLGIRALVEGAMATIQHMAPYIATTEIHGPDVLISPRQVLPLTLVLVEWFTNSCKYGASSVPGGRLDVRWTMELGSPAPKIHLTWTERGGPPVTAPTKPSLGTELVQLFARRELYGTAQMRYGLQGADHILDFVASDDMSVK